MTNSEESIPLKDRYESLKLLCSEQVLANELLKDEVDRLRKCFNEISKHRAFLLDKLLAVQASRGSSEDLNPKKNAKSSNSTYSQKRAPATQITKGNSSYDQGSHRGKGNSNEIQPYDDSDRESDSWVHQQGDYYNGWEDQLNVPSYRRSFKQQPKKRPSSRGQQPSSSTNTSPFKRPRMSGGSAQPSISSRPPMRFNPSDDCSPGLSPSDDYSEEPPIIYSAAKSKPDIQRNSAGVSVKALQHRVGASPNILKSPSPASTGNSYNSVQISGNASSGTRIYIQKPSVTGGYVAPRMH